MTEHFDILIIGAGVSAISSAYYLQKNCPKKSYRILETRSRIGGTWDLFKYPGIRSDSDMLTYGFSFNPWEGKEILASGDEIRDYIEETARKFDIYPHIRFNHKVVRASWSSAEALWTVEVEHSDRTFTANFIFGCTGYYQYEEGYTPDFIGSERFRGKIVHPQQWPEELNYEGKKVLVIGSGATAITLIPNIAKTAAHVTMLQRSPTYIIAIPRVDPMAVLYRILPKKMAFWLLRWKNIGLYHLIYFLAKHFPKQMKKLLIWGVQIGIGKTYDTSKDFSPRYNPWQQRLCVVPSGDLFDAIKSGTVSVVTDEIETFTEQGIKLKSRKELQADIIVTATGFNVLIGGGIDIHVDGRHMDLSKVLLYKGTMLSEIPNFAIFLGYTFTSWTLRAELISAYLCRLLKRMDKIGAHQLTPRLTHHEEAKESFFGDFTPGYILRKAAASPKQGAKAPWRMHQNYRKEYFSLKFGKLEDDVLEFR